jgi:hypothetical protein
VEVGQYHKQLFGQQLHGSIAPASSELWDITKAGMYNTIQHKARMKNQWWVL